MSDRFSKGKMVVHPAETPPKANVDGLSNLAYKADSPQLDRRTTKSLNGQDGPKTSIEMDQMNGQPHAPNLADDEFEDLEEEVKNPCMVFINKIQNAWIEFYQENKSHINLSIVITVLVAVLAFVVAGLVLRPGKTYPLAIIIAVVAFFIFYYKILVKYCGPAFSKNVRKPFEDAVTKAWTKKLVRWAVFAAILIAIIVFLIVDCRDSPQRLISLAGLLMFILLTFVFSKNPGKVNWRPVLWGLALQFIFGLIVLRWSVGRIVFAWLSEQVNAFLHFTYAGTSFVYGFLVNTPNICGFGPVFAFSVLPTVIFFSSCVSILYYLGVMQGLVKKMAGIMQFTMGTTAAESLSCAGNIFIGQTEAPLLIKPYIGRMTLSEICAVMTGGFSTIAGTVFAIYVSFGACGNHILSASVMSAPAAMAISKLFYPETKKSKTKTLEDLELLPSTEKNLLEAAANGATNGVFLVANIIANLIAFLAFLEFINQVVMWLGAMVGYDDLTFVTVLSWLFYPLAFMMGASTNHEELLIVAELMGVKTFLNEFIAYKRMGDYLQADKLSPRAHLIATYALCGFSNLAAIGVQLGGLGVMAPSRRSALAQVVMRAMIAGSIACFMTACVAGVLTTDVGECVGLISTNSTCVHIA